MLNINDSINYFIVSTYKAYILFTLYYIYAQTQINLLIRKLVVPCPLTPSIYYTGGF